MLNFNSISGRVGVSKMDKRQVILMTALLSVHAKNLLNIYIYEYIVYLCVCVLCINVAYIKGAPRCFVLRA